MSPAAMVYWAHVVGTFLMRYVPVALAYKLVTLATPVWLQIFARGHVRRATDNMRQVLGPHADPKDAQQLTRKVFAN